MNDRNEILRGVRFTRQEARRAARSARVAAGAAVALIAGSCGVMSYWEANSIGACIGCGFVFFPVSLVVLPILLAAAAYGLKARSLHRQADETVRRWSPLGTTTAAGARAETAVNRRSDETPGPLSGRQAAPTGPEAPSSQAGLVRREPRTEAERLPTHAQRDLELAKRNASESLWFAVASLLVLPVAFVTAPIAISRGCAANRTFLQFPERAHNYGKATAMAGITLAWVAIAFAPFLFIALLSMWFG